MNYERAEVKVKDGCRIRRAVWDSNTYMRSRRIKSFNEWGDEEYRDIPIKRMLDSSQCAIEIIYNPSDEDRVADDWEALDWPCSIEMKARAYDELKALLEDMPIDAIDIPKHECLASCKDCVRLHDCRILGKLRFLLREIKKSKLRRSDI